ncbi:MAG: hypothetical protein ABIS51_20755 [Sphingomonas sp.]
METIPHFHDGYLTGVRLREGAATLYLREVDGPEYELILEGLEALHIEDFREGNIISCVEIVTGRTPYAHIDFDQLFVPPGPSAAAQYREKHAAVLERHIARIESGEVCLTVIAASYGAQVLAICREAACHPV